jgi:DNA-binding winged helix-turn-helix (wHTH) protein
MLKLSDLALRPDLQLGPMLVSPSRRLVEGPGGHAHVEPLIMQVFLLLLDAGGRVVTRTQLFDQCWGGVIVGDDSLNRAIAKVRRTGAQVAPGLFEIETIPRTGYRLTGEILQHFNGQVEMTS